MGSVIWVWNPNFSESCWAFSAEILPNSYLAISLPLRKSASSIFEIEVLKVQIICKLRQSESKPSARFSKIETTELPVSSRFIKIFSASSIIKTELGFWIKILTNSGSVMWAAIWGWRKKIFLRIFPVKKRKYDVLPVPGKPCKITKPLSFFWLRRLVMVSCASAKSSL